MVTRHLTGKGVAWLLYTAGAAYAMNTFISPELSGFSPFELVFVYNPLDLHNLSLPPLEQFTNYHKDYLQLPKTKVEFMAGILLDYKGLLVQDRVFNA